MKILKSHITAAALVAASGLSAQTWTLVDNFEDDVNGDNFDQWTIGRSQYNVIGLLPEYEDGDEAYLQLIYPEGYPDNAALHVESGGYGKAGQAGDTHVICPLPITPADGDTTTLYFQYYQQGGNNEFHFGMTTLPAVAKDPLDTPIMQLLDAPSTWGDFSFLFYLKPDNRFGIRDGSGYRLNTEMAIESYTWYEMWFVIRNRVGDDYGEDGDTWELWIRGGEWDVPTQVLVPPAEAVDPITGETNPYKTWASWRNPAARGLTYVMYTTQTGFPDAPNDGDPHLVDDIYIADGESVETPAGATWPRVEPDTYGSYAITLVDDGAGNMQEWIDTGSWMGWIAIYDRNDAGACWSYMLDLDAFVFMGRPPAETDAGNWLFFLR